MQIENIPALATAMGQKLMGGLVQSTSRKQFITALAEMLRTHIPFDRLCINLYDHEGNMLTYFTAAEGTIVSTLSPVRPAEASSTVAGKVIATRRPVIITDFSQHFPESAAHPIAEAGLNATMAFPLILDNEIIATLHCSFARAPEHLYECTSFLLALSPVVAICLGAILLQEQARAKHTLAWQPLTPPAEGDTIICHSPRMREVMRTLDVVSKLDIPVLLLGETGTGKSLIAQAIHRRSLRKSAHFVKVNCPSLPQTLFESELFGHAKGSFTGAVSKRVGRFELAHGGTLFLDEIAELSPEMQSKLLQVLEDSSFERVGESVSLAVDVRIVAATNVRLSSALAQNKLRADLLYRISPCSIELPPLRQRQEDIAPLVSALGAQLSRKLGLPGVSVRGAALGALREHHWPGNVRELRNVVIKLLVLHSMGKPLNTVTVEQVLRESADMAAAPRTENAAGPGTGQGRSPRNAADSREGRGCNTPPHPDDGETDEIETLATMEKNHILKALRHCGGAIAGPQGAAALLGLPRSTLQHRMGKLGIKPR